MARHTLLTSRSILWNTLARGARVFQPGWSTRLCLSRPRTSRLRVARTHIPVGWDFFFSGITCVYSGDGFWDSPCLSRRRLRAHEIPSGELGRLVNRRYCVGRVWDAIVTVQGFACTHLPESLTACIWLRCAFRNIAVAMDGGSLEGRCQSLP